MLINRRKLQKVNEDNAIARVTLGLNLSCCACLHQEHDRKAKRNENQIKSPLDNNSIDGSRNTGYLSTQPIRISYFKYVIALDQSEG